MDEAERMVLDARLQNWGRWSREARKQGTSNLWPILQRLQTFNLKGKTEETPANDDHQAPINAKDAEEIEAALVSINCGTFSDRRCVELMVALYVRPEYPIGKLLHSMRLRYRNMAPMVRRAQDLMAQALNRRRTFSVRLPAAPRGITKQH